MWIKGQDVLVNTSPRGKLERVYRDQRDRMWQAVFAFAGDRATINSQAEADAVNAARGKLYTAGMRPYIHAALTTW